MTAPFTREPGPGRRAGGDDLVQWAERSGGVAGCGSRFTGGYQPRTGRTR